MFEVGQKVLCVDDRPRHKGGLDGLRSGSVYTVSEIYITSGCHPLGSFALAVSEILRPLDDIFWHPDNRGFHSDRFVALNDPSIELFRQMTREFVDAI